MTPFRDLEKPKKLAAGKILFLKKPGNLLRRHCALWYISGSQILVHEEKSAICVAAALKSLLGKYLGIQEESGAHKLPFWKFNRVHLSEKRPLGKKEGGRDGSPYFLSRSQKRRTKSSPRHERTNEDLFPLSPPPLLLSVVGINVGRKRWREGRSGKEGGGREFESPINYQVFPFPRLWKKKEGKARKKGGAPSSNAKDAPAA